MIVFMLGYVANTDLDWFSFLSAQSDLDEINFWNPSDRTNNLSPSGSVWFFRLKAPVNLIGGFGIIARYSHLPEWLAWECFGRGNGFADLERFQEKLRAIRDKNKMKREPGAQQIGCLILTQPVFFPRPMWLPQPDDWSPNNLTYKGYDLNSGEGLRIWRECQERVRTLSMARQISAEIAEFAQRYGSPQTILPRLGQGTFRVAVTDAYGRACAVTGEHSLPVLEAAHIKPYGQGGEHEIRNGLLLRSDLHRLFDRGYITVTPQYRVEVSQKLRDDYHNGTTYYPFDGRTVSMPQAIGDAPAVELLRWHNEAVYRDR